jgi:pyridoxal phosphate enzyme (YggS family)
MSVRENIESLKKRIENAAQRAERDPDEITVVAVTKTVPVVRIEEAIMCGIRIIGENRVQEASRKFSSIGDRITWHMVGHLQTNKVKRALEIFSMIQSLDSLKLAQEINKRAEKEIDCLIEVNTSKESSKFGLKPAQIFDFFTNLRNLKRIKVLGLMTIGPGWAIHDPEVSRPCFRTLRELRDEMSEEYDRPFPVLSMGMTSDFEVAIEEGSNMIRIGTAIFGPRK